MGHVTFNFWLKILKEISLQVLYDITILNVVVVCSESILSVMFQYFKR